EGLKEGRLDLALDLTAEQAHELREAPGVAVPLPRPGGLNRRIYFLAVNHRHPLLKKKDLRLALAQAIDREALLDAHFRGPLGKRVHRALNGPYPAGGWACEPGLKGRRDADGRGEGDGGVRPGPGGGAGGGGRRGGSRRSS